MRSLFLHKPEFDWRKNFDPSPETRKERLLKACEQNEVSSYVDSPTETTSGIHALFRSVASEAELERRLLVKFAATKSTSANRIAALSFLVSLVSLIVSIWRK